MRKTLLMVAILGGTLVSGSAVGNAESGLTVFSPASSANRAEQQQQAVYDAQQQKLDQQLDRQLNICRGC